MNNFWILAIEIWKKTLKVKPTRELEKYKFLTSLPTSHIQTLQNSHYYYTTRILHTIYHIYILYVFHVTLFIIISFCLKWNRRREMRCKCIFKMYFTSFVLRLWRGGSSASVASEVQRLCHCCHHYYNNYCSKYEVLKQQLFSYNSNALLSTLDIVFATATLLPNALIFISSHLFLVFFYCYCCVVVAFSLLPFCHAIL